MEITNPVLTFAFIMLIILIAPVLFTRLRLPGIVGLIVTGIIIGPHALGILKPEGSLALFSSVGLIYLMFLAGLEINLNEFNHQKKHSIIFGTLTFLTPMMIGTFGSQYLFGLSWPASLLLASMFASHTLIPFPITTRLGINKHRSIVTTVGGTIITDTAAMLLLAIIAESATNQLTSVFWIRQIIFLLALIWFSLWILPRLAYSCFKILASNGENEFLLTLIFVFLTAYLAQLAGVEPIIGAFFAGLSLSRLISDASPLKNRLEFFGQTFFIPFFLVSVGMLVNLRVMVSGWDIWAMAAFMIAAVLFSKYLAAFIFTSLQKFTRDECNLIFGLSVNQAAATLAAVIVGFRLGIFNDAILNGTILMILVTCLIGPWFTEKYGQKIASRHALSAIPRNRAEERIMVAVSRNESACFLTDVALGLRSNASREPIFPLYVIQDGVDVERRILKGEKILGEVVNHLVAADIPVSPVSKIDINIPGGILRALKESHADVLVLGVVPAKQSNFKTVLFDVSDKICDESRQLLVQCQMAHPLNIGKCIFVFVPPLLEHQDGFSRALELLKNLASKNKLRLHFIGMTDAIRQAEKILSHSAPDTEILFSPVDQWVDCSEYLKKMELIAADSIILMAAKKGRLGWNPSLKRTFHNLGSNFPENNIMMLSLPDANWETTGHQTGDKNSRSDLSALLARPAIQIRAKLLDDAVPQLLKSQFALNSKILPEILKRLFPLEPIELASGIVLLHTHSDHLTDPVILLGRSQDGVLFSSLKEKIHEIFILISPYSQTNVHLQALTRVARIARDLENQKKDNSG